jgi:phosphatidylserine/phosphatidylglycerophosphate/cardiolipin synthase-like enzyme
MRTQQTQGPLTVRATAGTHNVLLGMDLVEQDTAGLLGFAIERTDHTEGERYWLRNSLVFDGADPGDRSFDSVVSPLQTFRWGDYSAKPDHDYTYRVVAMKGRPGTLEPAAEVSARVRTEAVQVGLHTVAFNRGAASSQLYAERFRNRPPSKVPHREAYRWLSRGLEEALLAFIGRAADASWQLRGAFYQFTHPSVLEALRIANDHGADVRLVVDGSPDEGSPSEANQAAVAAAGLEDVVVWREHSMAIPHNKFLVTVHNGQPTAVWTGSTNITEGGIFGHSNVGHAVDDPGLASAYLEYWERLAADPTTQDIRPWVGDNPAVPTAPPEPGLSWLFSPRSGSAALLDWYTERIRSADRALFLTAAFGVTERLRTAFLEDRDALRYLLLDNARGGIDLVIRDGDPDNQVSVGGSVPRGGFRQWLEESTLGLNTHARYIHTKFLLVDPLGDDPVVITGSGNFSPASVSDNDENMLVIRGDTAVADVYLTEFMRLFTHYEFRYSVARRRPRRGLGAEPQQAVTGRRTLYPDDSWVPRWYKPGSPREKERRLFAGT